MPRRYILDFKAAARLVTEEGYGPKAADSLGVPPPPRSPGSAATDRRRRRPHRPTARAPKRERVHRASYATRQEAERSLFESIEVFSKRRRLHSSLGELSPVPYGEESETASCRRPLTVGKITVGAVADGPELGSIGTAAEPGLTR